MMNERLKITQAIIVEGKYDKIKLSNIVDAFIIETNGFGVFKDKEKLKFIKKLAKERGIIVLTDSDHAGFMIRNYISSGVQKDRITNVYIPDILGKERRKEHASKEGKLGVEGMSIACEATANPDPLTNFDLYEAGLSGTPNAKERKKALLKKLDLPEFLSTSSLLSCINNMMSKNEFFEIVSEL